MKNNEIISQWEENRKKIKYNALPTTVKWLKDYYQWDEWQKAMLNLTPDYQRLYKWKKQQKTDLIESILLWIPLPPLFFSETIDWKYEIIDWLQRTCTVLEYIGVLNDKIIKDKNESIKEWLWQPVYLTEISTKKFEELPNEMKTRIFWYTFSINLLTSDSDESAKHELFNRLNSWWTPLTKQEIRNTFFIQFKKEIYDKIMNLRNYPEFINIVSPSEKEIESESDTELILKFFALIDFEWEYKYNTVSVANFLDTKMKEMINKKINLNEYETYFENVFSILNKTFLDDSLKRFDYNKNKFVWRFSTPWFDTIVWGIWYNLKKWNISENCIEYNKCIEKIRKRIKALWMSNQWNKHIGIWWFIGHKLQVAIFIGRKLFNMTEDFWKTEKEISKKIDELLIKKFSKK